MTLWRTRSSTTVYENAWIRVRDNSGREIYRAAVWSENVEKVGWDET